MKLEVKWDNKFESFISQITQDHATKVHAFLKLSILDQNYLNERFEKLLLEKKNFKN